MCAGLFCTSEESRYPSGCFPGRIKSNNFGSTTPIAMAGSAAGADSNPHVLELSMKSKYRQAVESVIAQEAKLAEVTHLHADAVSHEQQLAEALRLNQEALAQYETRVAELEYASDSLALQEVQSELKEINATMKFLCREVMRPEA